MSWEFRWFAYIFLLAWYKNMHVHINSTPHTYLSEALCLNNLSVICSLLFEGFFFFLWFTLMESVLYSTSFFHIYWQLSDLFLKISKINQNFPLKQNIFLYNLYTSKSKCSLDYEHISKFKLFECFFHLNNKYKFYSSFRYHLGPQGLLTHY